MKRRHFLKFLSCAPGLALMPPILGFSLSGWGGTYNNGKEFADHAVVDEALKSTLTADELKMIQDSINHYANLYSIFKR